MTTPNLSELRRLASEATPGPWLQPIEDQPRLLSKSDGRESLLGLDETGDGQEAIVWELADANFIAAANPQTVLALLDKIEAQELHIERLIAKLDEPKVL